MNTGITLNLKTPDSRRGDRRENIVVQHRRQDVNYSLKQANKTTGSAVGEEGKKSARDGESHEW